MNTSRRSNVPPELEHMHLTGKIASVVSRTLYLRQPFFDG